MQLTLHPESVFCLEGMTPPHPSQECLRELANPILENNSEKSLKDDPDPTHTRYFSKTVAKNLEFGRTLASGIIRADSHNRIVRKVSEQTISKIGE